MQRHLRLRRWEDFRRLRATGRVWPHPFFLLSVAPNGLSYNRYGFVTSKQLGNAVVRNTIRRRLREIIRRAHPCLVSGYDMALIVRAPVVGQPYAVVDRAVVALLQQAGLWQSGELEP
jgi:ribonuclease P protein component